MEFSSLNGSNSWDQQHRPEDAEDETGINDGADARAEAEPAERPHIFVYTRAVRAIIDAAEAIAKALRHHEISGTHIVAGLALETAGQAELKKRKLDVASVHRAALHSLSGEPTVPAQKSMPMSDALRDILLRAEELARGCETAKRAISTQDLVAAILESDANDAAHKLLTGSTATTPAEEARDQAKALGETIDRFVGEMSGAAATTQSKLDKAQLKLDTTQSRLDTAVAQLDTVLAQLAAQKGAQQELQARMLKTEAAVTRAAEKKEVAKGTGGMRVAASWTFGVVLAGVCGYLLGKGIPGLESVTTIFRGLGLVA